MDKNPHRTVTIPLIAAPLEGADPGDYAVPTEVVFNAGETSKDVTVTVVDDSVDDDGESVEMTFGMLPAGVSEGATTRAVVQITDNDDKGILLSPTSLVVTEGGRATYTVALDSEPTADVTVTITGHARTDLTLTPTTAMLTFTPSTWDRTQTVTVAAGDDGDALNDSALLTHRAVGAAEYASVTASLSVTVTDDDTKATGAPAITGIAEVGEELTANTSGIADADGLNNVSYVYQWVRVASGGVETDIPLATLATYRVIADDVGAALKVKARFTDDKGNPESAESALTAVVTVAQVVATFGAGPYAAEEGRSARVRVSLDKNPHRTVTIPLIAAPLEGADPGDYAVPTEVVFNAGETSKDVTVTVVDDSVDDDGERVELTFGMLPAGVSEGATTRAVVQITDNDDKGILLSPTSLVVTEGGRATYTVALDSEPTADVTVTITGHARTDLTLTPTTAMLTFTPSTWDRTQTVTVAAGDDGDALNDSALLTHRAVGAAEYASVTASLSVTVTDDDTKATGAPAITGIAEVGEELTANTSGIADGDGLSNVSYQYQWERVASGGQAANISGATSDTYTVQAADVGRQLKVRVRFTDDKGNPESAGQRAHRGSDGGSGEGFLWFSRLRGGGRRSGGRGSDCLGQGPASYGDDSPDCRAPRGSGPRGLRGTDRGCLQRR